MKNITEKAVQHLKNLVSRRSADRKRCLRLVPGRGGFGLVVDKVRENDKVIDHRGTPILVLHPVLASALEDAILDCRDYPEGPRLTVLR